MDFYPSVPFLGTDLKYVSGKAQDTCKKMLIRALLEIVDENAHPSRIEQLS